MSSALSSALGGLVNDSGVSVVFRSAVTPPLTLIAPSSASAATGGSGANATGSGGSGAGGIVPWLQPAVDILASDGTVITTIAPYGDPGNGLQGALIAAGILVTVLALTFAAGAKWG
jgi:hypothetical protein